jgi:hypothetical protein
MICDEIGVLLAVEQLKMKRLTYKIKRLTELRYKRVCIIVCFSWRLMEKTVFIVITSPRLTSPSQSHFVSTLLGSQLYSISCVSPQSTQRAKILAPLDVCRKNGYSSSSYPSPYILGLSP